METSGVRRPRVIFTDQALTPIPLSSSQQFNLHIPRIIAIYTLWSLKDRTFKYGVRFTVFDNVSCRLITRLCCASGPLGEVGVPEVISMVYRTTLCMPKQMVTELSVGTPRRYLLQ